MIRVLFLIRSLDAGGAQRQLITLVSALDKQRMQVTVATFYPGGTLRGELEGRAGVRVVSLDKRGKLDVAVFFWRLWQLVRRERPAIVHGYMGVANEYALLAGRLVGARVVWGLRASNMDFTQYHWSSGVSFRVGAVLSRFADLIIANSEFGRRHHISHGYCGDRMIVIPNGIDTDHFHPDGPAGNTVRAEWAIPRETPLIGIVGRLDPMKDHRNFLDAAAVLSKQQPDVRFICIGAGPPAYQDELHLYAQSLDLAQKVIWAGGRNDMAAVYNALDIVVSSSISEAFSNSIGEAMSCGTPCVVTDVGDSAMIVGDTTLVAPPADPQSLARCCERLLQRSAEERRAIGQAARARIVESFSTERLARDTEAALTHLLADRSIPQVR